MGRLFNSDGGGGRSKRALFGVSGAQDLIPRRFTTGGSSVVTTEDAMKNSAVWAACRIRADLVSTLPWRVYRELNLPDADTPYKLDVSPTPLMSGIEFMHFLYATQIELDRAGNAIGIIEEWDERTKTPAYISLQPTSSVTVIGGPRGVKSYRINGVEYDPEVIWHEKQYTVPGLPVGLSPVSYAAYSLGQYRSIQEFATEFFTSGEGPRASLRNTEKKISTKEAAVAAESWRASQNMDEPFIHGNDWEYKLMQVQSASNDWLEGMKLNEVEVARFFNVPADLIDVAISGGSHVTYSNIIQRNLQFLVMHLGPAITRREAALSDMLPRPRQFEFDTDFLMRMDPMTRAQWITEQINARVMTPNEGRAVFGRDPLSAEQFEEFFKAGLVHGKSAILPGDPQDPNDNPAIDSQIEAEPSVNNLQERLMDRSQTAHRRNFVPKDRLAYRSEHRSEIPGGTWRSCTFPGEMRGDFKTVNGREVFEVEGYATVYERGYEMWDFAGKYLEIMDGHALDLSLARSPDVAFLTNHKGVTMARTRASNGKSPTLILKSDVTGLHIQAWLNAERQDVKDLASAINDGIIDEMSFAFMIEDAKWNDDYTEFRITQANIDRGDVSAVNYGANPFTSIEARSAGLLRELDQVPAVVAREALTLIQRRLDTSRPMHEDVDDELADAPAAPIAADRAKPEPRTPARKPNPDLPENMTIEAARKRLAGTPTDHQRRLSNI